jgi:hypothetical protein
MITREKDDVLAFTGSFGAFKNKRCRVREGRKQGKKKQDIFHGMRDADQGWSAGAAIVETL